MEILKIEKEIKFLKSINKWCCSIWCFREKHSIWTGGFFDKSKKKSEELAMESFKKDLEFYRKIEKPVEKEIIYLTL